jgi:hypothetical protein
MIAQKRGGGRRIAPAPIEIKRRDGRQKRPKIAVFEFVSD